jgi:hypothetical protein
MVELYLCAVPLISIGSLTLRRHTSRQHLRTKVPLSMAADRSIGYRPDAFVGK